MAIDLEISVTPIPTMIQGPQGTVCVNPALFGELVAYNDAIKLGVILFVIGMALGWVYCHYSAEQYHEEEEG